MNKPYKVEICLDSVESAINAQFAGADRVELCANLCEGGTTPSAGMIRMVRKSIKIGLQVIIRPRGGDFYYTDEEIKIMKDDILFCKENGVDGVVLGMLKTDGCIDVKLTKALVDLSRPMNVTFHRAFDMTADPYIALEDVIATGADRLLSSGQQNSAIEGIKLLKKLIKQANNRIIIMPGSGININNLETLVSTLNPEEIHLSASKQIKSEMSYQAQNISMSSINKQSEYVRKITDVDLVRAIISKEKK